MYPESFIIDCTVRLTPDCEDVKADNIKFETPRYRVFIQASSTWAKITELFVTDMVDVVTLLTLPKVSQGFTTLRPTAFETERDGSPPRKAPRLDTSISASTSTSSHSHNRSEARSRKAGPVRIQVVGASGEPALFRVVPIILVFMPLSDRTATSEGRTSSTEFIG
jgi:hypothetical protein